MPARLIAGAKNCQRAWRVQHAPASVGREARLAEEMWRQRRVAVGRCDTLTQSDGTSGRWRAPHGLFDIDTAHVAGRDEAKIEEVHPNFRAKLVVREVMAVGKVVERWWRRCCGVKAAAGQEKKQIGRHFSHQCGIRPKVERIFSARCAHDAR